MIAIAVMTLSWGSHHEEVLIMPVFKPNDWLFENHKDKGQTKWEIFAWAVRDAMCTESGIKPHDKPVREKLAYMKYMYGRAKDW
eukprot:CAMPEP_0176372268 /NCGR_PEP_ID=MMETSP0126-20121128/25281_1 /TAXON_ID=141414 ORGANISM="Strombidinopsis acuminatum, Strain SPMC142" /NCGR_SAMPLE_ID=MMETSP0126 /ASSEMBLY_ACC=CAM_ASM_000229 /LENGTH=83 /DNA_ID=CAMNT_0017732061 /DNA_START=846 /DNA_END=1094 /DNA_ORIENTATION=+